MPITKPCRQCDHNSILKVIWAGVGRYYIGYHCPCCGPVKRVSRIYSNPAMAIDALAYLRAGVPVGVGV